MGPDALTGIMSHAAHDIGAYLWSGVADMGNHVLEALSLGTSDFDLGSDFLFQGSIVAQSSLSKELLAIPEMEGDLSARSSVRSAGSGFHIGVPALRLSEVAEGLAPKKKPTLVGERESLDSRRPGKYSEYIGTIGWSFILADAAYAFVLYRSWVMPCESLNLRGLGLAGLLLGFPTTLLIDGVAKHGLENGQNNFRLAFALETGATVASFCVMAYTTAALGQPESSGCIHTNPALWWSTFVTSVLGLSVTGTMIFCMVLTTVLSVAHGYVQSKSVA